MAKVICWGELFATENGLPHDLIFEILISMVAQLSLSCRIDSWVETLILELEQNQIDPLETGVVLVPNQSVKQWLLIEIAKRKGVAMGLKVIEIEQLLPPSIHSLLMGTLIYKELKQSIDPDVLGYIGGKQRRLIDLTKELSSLFFSYGQFGKNLFEKSPSNWQERLLHKLFCQGSLRLPVQMDSRSPLPIISFGIDFFPPVYWNFLFHSPSISIYLFSPCAHFWEDLSSDRERKKVNRLWKKRGASKKRRDELDAYLREGPRRLANWGKIGRETLKQLDRFDLEVKEFYPPLEPNSFLKQIQFDLLTFQETKNVCPDDSLKIFSSGSSKLKEIECLRDEILRLQIPYSEISVLAPDIAPYVPLIQYVFNETIPYRISGVDMAPQSSFRQGMIRWIELGTGRWGAEEVLALFETPSFYRKQGWDQETLEQIREWVSQARIQWGIDQKQRENLLSSSLGSGLYEDFGSWEKGIDFLLHSIVYFSPLHVDADLFEELIQIIEKLKTISLNGEKTFFAWADVLESAADQFLAIDPTDEADLSCFHAFRQFLTQLRNSQEEALFPIEFIKPFLFPRSIGQIHSNSLHAVRFAPLEEGALIPGKALFLIGMDEEQFPRPRTSSSLDLLKGVLPDRADRDRYLFLQALFSAQEYLRISYGHLSPEEGKPVAPSLVVQELLSGFDLKPEVYQAPPLPPLAQRLAWPRFQEAPLPEGEITVSLSDLRLLAHHPWKFYLSKGVGVYLDPEWEESFAVQKGTALRSTLRKPIDEVLAEQHWIGGPLGEALRSDVAERGAEWKKLLAERKIELFSLNLRQNCQEPHWEEEKYIGSDSNNEKSQAVYIVPPLEIKWENLKVILVGQVQHVSQKGLISLNEDSIGGVLKVWPEALVVSMIFNAPELLILKSGKSKPIEGALKALKSFLEYYFAALKAPSPLLPDWGVSLLRNQGADLEKKIKKGSSFEDPFVDWVFSRGMVSEGKEMVEDWVPFLKETFEPLSALYPARGKSHAAL